jgi:hypothetical protein
VLSGEATNINFSLWFDPIRAQGQTAIYRTRGEHANHYTIGAVKNITTFIPE